MRNVSTNSVNLPRLIVPKRHLDDRGWFNEIFHQARFREIGIACRFIQGRRSVLRSPCGHHESP
jgi:dTDP-4-dehydrorhamnose 3,5-epimerase-like enzyme